MPRYLHLEAAATRGTAANEAGVNLQQPVKIGAALVEGVVRVKPRSVM